MEPVDEAVAKIAEVGQGNSAAAEQFHYPQQKIGNIIVVNINGMKLGLKVSKLMPEMEQSAIKELFASENSGIPSSFVIH